MNIYDSDQVPSGDLKSCSCVKDGIFVINFVCMQRERQQSVPQHLQCSHRQTGSSEVITVNIVQTELRDCTGIGNVGVAYDMELRFQDGNLSTPTALAWQHTTFLLVESYRLLLVFRCHVNDERDY